MKKKTKSNKKLEWLDFGIFPGKVLFCYNLKYLEICNKLYTKETMHWLKAISQDSDRKVIDSGNWCALKRELINNKTGDIKKLFYIIVPKEFDYSDYDYAKLAHEITHICQFYLPEILDRNREYEAEAYLHTHIMMQCLKAIKGDDKSNRKLRK